jgi:hypothetical protein
MTSTLGGDDKAYDFSPAQKDKKEKGVAEGGGRIAQKRQAQRRAKEKRPRK